jgi:Flp pilus assembly protein TadG
MIRHFLRAREGSVLLIFAIASVAVVGAVGVAVDTGRSQMVQAKLQNAVDAAGLAAGATVSTTDLTAVATKYVNLNFTQGNLGATLGTVTATLSADKKVVTVTATATLATSMMKLFGRNTVTIDATTEVTRASKGMELLLVLDNTGSMNSPVNSANSGVSKIAALKTAVAGTGGLLDILYGSNSTVENLWVGVVPFSQAVNIGTGTSWTNANAYDWGVPVQPWKGCVMARSAPYDTSDDPSSVSKFDAYYAPTTGTVTAPIFGTGVSGSCSGGINSWKCTVLLNGKNKLTYDFTAGKTPNAYCPQAVTPMVAEKATVVTAINSMTAAGSTFINTGMAWGYRMLSPRWRGLWGGQMNTNSLPLNYNSPLMNKVVVLMTDGMNSFSSGNFTNYGFLSDNQLGSIKSMNSGWPYTGSAEEKLDQRTLAVCNALKANGVIIYTIGFGQDDSNNFASATSVNGPLLKACATSGAYYFLAPTNTELQAAFAAIGDSLANLRISK